MIEFTSSQLPVTVATPTPVLELCGSTHCLQAIWQSANPWALTLTVSTTSSTHPTKETVVMSANPVFQLEKVEKHRIAPSCPKVSLETPIVEGPTLEDHYHAPVFAESGKLPISVCVVGDPLYWQDLYSRADVFTQYILHTLRIIPKKHTLITKISSSVCKSTASGVYDDVETTASLCECNTHWGWSNQINLPVAMPLTLDPKSPSVTVYTLSKISLTGTPGSTRATRVRIHHLLPQPLRMRITFTHEEKTHVLECEEYNKQPSLPTKKSVENELKCNAVWWLHCDDTKEASRIYTALFLDPSLQLLLCRSNMRLPLEKKLSQAVYHACKESRDLYPLDAFNVEAPMNTYRIHVKVDRATRTACGLKVELRTTTSRLVCEMPLPSLWDIQDHHKVTLDASKLTATWQIDASITPTADTHHISLFATAAGAHARPAVAAVRVAAQGGTCTLARPTAPGRYVAKLVAHSPVLGTDTVVATSSEFLNVP
eukprot:TRINITY_DN14894_c0_g1_i1.p1 TRINITY_DN14894_c0_g1~~TRINITY_DN14894_c0_g1_i1.p1  ORF type:complete len:568 (-),score=137.93 TRINITY_DN14894_c0_g1_i1:10-1467(-)